MHVNPCASLGDDIQVVMHREQRELEAIGHTDFVEDVRQVVFDGLFADRESFRNLLVLIRVHDCSDDLPLACGETEIARLLARRSGGATQTADGGHQVGHALASDEIVA